MYSRVTLLEIDTLRADVEEATELFRGSVLPALRACDGFEGALVLATPDGKGMILTLWTTEEAADAAGGVGTEMLEHYMALFTAPPGRECYEVVCAELPIGAPALR
jgi:hypothetical protein